MAANSFVEVWEKSKDILWGFTENEGRALWTAAKSVQKIDGKAVEVGCMIGSTARMIADALGHVVCVDPFSPDSLRGLRAPFAKEDVLSLFLKNTADIRDRVEMIQKPDYEVFRGWSNAQGIRFLHLDHCHTFQGTLASLEGWRPSLVDGAVVALHDYADDRFPGIRKAVEETDLVVDAVVDSLAICHFPSTVELTVITPTYNRLSNLYQMLQGLASLDFLSSFEHIVVSDGHDPNVEAICKRFGVQYDHTPQHVGDWGKSPLDVGVSRAVGEYVAFFDDDNFYHENCLDYLHDAADGFDIGVCRVNWWDRKRQVMHTLPRQWTGSFKSADIDTANACINRRYLIQSGITCAGVANGAYGSDFELLKALERRGARINYREWLVADHI